LVLAEISGNGQSDLDAAGPIGRHDLVDMQCKLTEQTLSNQTPAKETLAKELLAEEPLSCCVPEIAPQETVRTSSRARPRVSSRSDKVSPAG
jgi:hypothetical protein